MRIVGIDENGYGPMLGPLVATGVEVFLEDTAKVPIFIKDSKKLFRGRTHLNYRRLEEAALKIIKSCEKGKDVLKDFSPPYWLREYPEENIQIKIIGFKSVVIHPEEFNKYAQFKTKSEINFLSFLKIIKHFFSEETEFFCGKIGGATYIYKKWLRKEFDLVEVIEEKKEGSSYMVGFGNKRTKINFFENAEDKSFPVAIASIVGKYLRELYMYYLCKDIGYEDKIPYSSGYYSDPTTREVLKKIKEKGLPEHIYVRKI